MEHGRVVLSTAAYTRVDDVLMLMSGNNEILEADMSAWIQRLGTFDYQYLLVSAVGGGGMTSKHRARVGEFWNKSGREHPKVAVLADSVITRHVSTAMSWLLNKPVKVFELHQVPEAIEYLGATAAAAEVARTQKAVHAALEHKARVKTA